MSNPEVEPSSRNVTRSDSATCFFVPLSFITIRSAVARVVEVAEVVVIPAQLLEPELVFAVPRFISASVI